MGKKIIKKKLTKKTVFFVEKDGLLNPRVGVSRTGDKRTVSIKMGPRDRTPVFDYKKTRKRYTPKERA